MFSQVRGTGRNGGGGEVGKTQVREADKLGWKDAGKVETQACGVSLNYFLFLIKNSRNSHGIFLDSLAPDTAYTITKLV